jgi:hypothetical protein
VVQFELLFQNSPSEIEGNYKESQPHFGPEIGTSRLGFLC